MPRRRLLSTLFALATIVTVMPLAPGLPWSASVAASSTQPVLRPNFGSGGIVEVPDAGGYGSDRFTAVAVASTGNIAVLSRDTIQESIVRVYDPSGRLVGQRAFTYFGNSSDVRVAADGADFLIATADTAPGQVSRVSVTKLSSQYTNGGGTMNTQGSFGVGGVFSATFAAEVPVRVMGVGVDGAGNIVVSGYFPSGEVVRATPSGGLDTSFGSGGFASVGFSRSLAVLADGSSVHLVPAGVSSALPNGGVAKLTDAGQLDGGFGSGGLLDLGYMVSYYSPGSITALDDGELAVQLGSTIIRWSSDGRTNLGEVSGANLVEGSVADGGGTFVFGGQGDASQPAFLSRSSDSTSDWTTDELGGMHPVAMAGSIGRSTYVLAGYDDNGVAALAVLGSYGGVDTVAPNEVVFYRPTAGSEFAKNEVATSSLGCGDAAPSSGIASCLGYDLAGWPSPGSPPVLGSTVGQPSGTALNTSQPGRRTLAGIARDFAGNTSMTSWVPYEVFDGVAGVTIDGGSVSSGGVPTATNPLNTTIVTPSAGDVRVYERPTSVPPPVGYTLGGQMADVRSLPGGAPSQLQFQLLGTMAAGATFRNVKVFFNGALLPACTASTDPCLLSVARGANGGMNPTVRTTHTGVVTFGAFSANVPAAPADVSGTISTSSVNVTWTAPDDGGSPITSYVVSATPTNNPAVGSRSATVTTTSATITGLAASTSYTLSVIAKNAAGTGPAGVGAFPVSTGAAPGAPTGVQATVSGNNATASWAAPSSAGGLPITSYRVTATPEGNPSAAVRTATSSTTSTTITRLLPSTRYSVVVQAVNALGSSAPSAAVSIVTGSFPDAPAAPAVVLAATAIANSYKASVTWSPVANTDSYKVNLYLIDATFTLVSVATVNGPATATILRGLALGRSYYVTVTAHNGFGDGPPSGASNPVVVPNVSTVPVTPSLRATVDRNNVFLQWSPAPANALAPVSGYVVTLRRGVDSVVVTYKVQCSSSVCQAGWVLPTVQWRVSVRAVNAAGEGPETPFPNDVYPGMGPAAPASVSVSVATPNASQRVFTVSWSSVPYTPGRNPTTGYWLWFHTPSGGGVVIPVAPCGTATCSWIATFPNDAFYASVNSVGVDAFTSYSNFPIVHSLETIVPI